MYGANRVLSEVAKAIIIAMGKGSNTKIFHDRDAAMMWLNAVDDEPQAKIDITADPTKV